MTYTTKDSGRRAEFASGMVRDTNEGKARFDLCHPLGQPYAAQMLTRFAMLMARGAVKYKARNWEQGDSQDELDRARESAARHFEQWLTGLDDEDHAAAVYFNIMAAEYFAWRIRQAKAEAEAKAEEDRLRAEYRRKAAERHPLDITGLSASFEITLDDEASANLARLFAAEPTAHVETRRCRTCGFVHVEADCPRWPASEDEDEDEDEDEPLPDQPVDYWPAYLSPHRANIETREDAA